MKLTVRQSEVLAMLSAPNVTIHRTTGKRSRDCSFYIIGTSGKILSVNQLAMTGLWRKEMIVRGEQIGEKPWMPFLFHVTGAGLDSVARMEADMVKEQHAKVR